jgi:EamA domain-containing membrane protein RarD
MLGLGAGGTAIANVLTATAAGRMGATTASIAAFLIPVVALLLGVVVRHEHVTALSLVGAGICLLGAALVRSPHLVTGLDHYLSSGLRALRVLRVRTLSAVPGSRRSSDR